MKAPEGLKKFILLGTLFTGCFALVLVVGLSLYLNPQLPSVQSLRSIELQTPLKIYSSDGKLIAEFGEKRRTPIAYEKVPPLFTQAILAAEDDRF